MLHNILMKRQIYIVTVLFIVMQTWIVLDVIHNSNTNETNNYNKNIHIPLENNNCNAQHKMAKSHK